MSSNEWATFDDIFSISSVGDKDACRPRQLGIPSENPLDYYTQTYEITVNFKQDKMTIVEHLDAYRNIWDHLKKQFRVVKDCYHVEKCESKQLHIHGYMTIEHHMNSYCYEDSLKVRAIAKQIFLILPRKYWKQFINARYDASIQRLKCPAVCISMKEILHNNWQNYMTKNAQQNA